MKRQLCYDSDRGIDSITNYVLFLGVIILLQCSAGLEKIDEYTLILLFKFF